MEVRPLHDFLAQDQIFVTVDILIMTVREGRLNLLLSRRANPPYPGRWALPGRLVATDEAAEAAVDRLLEEMLPVRGAFCEQLYTFTDVDRDPRGRVVSIAYLVIVPWARLAAIPEGQFGGLRRFGVALDAVGLRLTGEDGAALTGGELAFDHGRIIATGVQRLRGKIEYTDIAFRFLNDPSAFYLSELQSVFEAVLDKPVDGSNFRRAIQSRYEDTGLIAQRAPSEQAPKRRGRPAALYRLNQP